jgi:hypothetical protein
MPLSSSILSRLQYQHQTISELTKNFTEEQLKQRINPDKWSAFENIAHLTAYQPTFIQRIELMVKEETPSFERYVAENDDLFYECTKLSLLQLVVKIDDDRAIIFSKLQSLSHEQLNRTGKHPKYGSLKIAQWADFFLLHEAHHLWAVMQLTYSIV